MGIQLIELVKNEELIEMCALVAQHVHPELRRITCIMELVSAHAPPIRSFLVQIETLARQDV